MSHTLDAHLRGEAGGSGSVSLTTRALGLAGILGGGALLAAFVVEIPAGLNDIRLALFLLGAIAVVAALGFLRARSSRLLARLVVIAAIGANGLYLLRLLLPYGPWHPFAGDNGFVFFVAGIALWVTDSVFGFMALRLGVVTRAGALALAIGSILALTGIDRLGLTSEADPTIFGPLSLVGLALNGLGWILIGLDIALGTDRRSALAGSPRR